MKRRLNILCLIVMLVLSYSVLAQAYYFFIGAKAGVEVAVKDGQSKTASRELLNMKYINLTPHSFSLTDGHFFCDSVYNEKSGTYVPAAYSSMAVIVDIHPAVWETILGSILPFLELILYIWAIVLFLRLIISINKSDIFNWKNVRRLRRLGFALVAGFCCTFAAAYLALREVEEVFTLSNYDLNLSDAVSITTLVLGLCSLIVGEVFAIGLKMKEEQDLTI